MYENDPNAYKNINQNTKTKRIKLINDFLTKTNVM